MTENKQRKSRKIKADLLKRLMKLISPLQIGQEKKKNPHIVNFKIKKRAITMNPAHIKKGNKIILEQLHANKFDNLHKKNKFAVKNDLTKTDGKSDTKSEQCYLYQRN